LSGAALSIAVLLFIAFLLAWAMVRQGAHLILQARGGEEVSAAQAPMPYAVLVELAAAADVGRPRMFVVPGDQPAGAIIRDQPVDILAIAEHALVTFTGAELRGLLAQLVAALTTSPTTQDGLSANRIFEIDRRAARLVGASSVIAALLAVERLEKEARRDPLIAPRLWTVAVRANGGIPSLFSNAPSMAERVGAMELERR
jgi:Zn-dependent protease with chaperone function